MTELVEDHTLIGKRVKVYFNIHKSGKDGSVFSIVDNETGLVVAYAEHVLLRDTVFKVRESGRQKVLETGQKNVHAWITGTVLDINCEHPKKLKHAVGYNPFKNPFFRQKDNDRKITEADLVFLGERCAWIA